MSTHTTATWLAPLALALLAGCGSKEPAQAPASQAAPVAALEAEGTAFAPATLPPLDPGAVARCSIDKVDGQPRGEAPHAARGSVVVVEGWVADAGLKVPAGFSVVLAGAGTWAARGESTVLREDVASVLGSPDLATSGFGVSASLAEVPAGEYAVDLLVAHGDGRHSLCATGVRLRVGAAG